MFLACLRLEFFSVLGSAALFCGEHWPLLWRLTTTIDRVCGDTFFRDRQRLLIFFVSAVTGGEQTGALGLMGSA